MLPFSKWREGHRQYSSCIGEKVFQGASDATDILSCTSTHLFIHPSLFFLVSCIKPGFQLRWLEELHYVKKFEEFAGWLG